jgi:hypothetical protein
MIHTGGQKSSCMSTTIRAGTNAAPSWDGSGVEREASLDESLEVIPEHEHLFERFKNVNIECGTFLE